MRADVVRSVSLDLALAALACHGGFLYFSYEILHMAGLYVHQWDVRLRDLSKIIYVRLLEFTTLPCFDSMMLPSKTTTKRWKKGKRNKSYIEMHHLPISCIPTNHVLRKLSHTNPDPNTNQPKQNPERKQLVPPLRQHHHVPQSRHPLPIHPPLRAFTLRPPYLPPHLPRDHRRKRPLLHRLHRRRELQLHAAGEDLEQARPGPLHQQPGAHHVERGSESGFGRACVCAAAAHGLGVEGELGEEGGCGVGFWGRSFVSFSPFPFPSFFSFSFCCLFWSSTGER